MMNFWKGKKVLVTGGLGFIGSHVSEKLLARGAKVSVLSRGTTKPGYLRELRKSVEIIRGDCQNMEEARKACKTKDVVMNLAARIGGIQFNRTHQATMLSENMVLATSMFEAARLERVERFLVVSSACIYPRDALVPTPESEGFRNEPEPTNGGYGWAKRMAEKLGQYYAEQYNMKVGIVRPYNAYGPRDHFNDENGHVIPALISRVFSGENPLKVWGSGKQTRAFLYVDDLAEGMIAAIEKYPQPDPINLGTNEEVSIADVVKKIIVLSGKKTKIVFDTSKPDGSPRRNSDNTKAKATTNFEARISFDEGLKKTIDWYTSTLLK